MRFIFSFAFRPTPKRRQQRLERVKVFVKDVLCISSIWLRVFLCTTVLKVAETFAERYSTMSTRLDVNNTL